MDYIEIKQKLIDMLIVDLQKQLKSYVNEMKKAQEEANYHKGAMQSRYDTFKEEAQTLKDGFARQYQNTSDLLLSLTQYKSIISINTTNKVTVGSLVFITENDKDKQYYILPDILYTIIELNDIKFECISSHTPLAKSLLGKEIGDEVNFNQMLFEITAIV